MSSIALSSNMITVDGIWATRIVSEAGGTNNSSVLEKEMW